MLQDLSTDRHTAWQLQNGASMQPSDLLDFALPSCFRYYLWFPYVFCVLFSFLEVIWLVKIINQNHTKKSDKRNIKFIFRWRYSKYTDNSCRTSPSCNHKVATAETIKLRQTDWDAQRLIWLYYLSFSASQVPCNALCAIDFYFSPSSLFIPGRLSLAISPPPPASSKLCNVLQVRRMLGRINQGK